MQKRLLPLWRRAGLFALLCCAWQAAAGRPAAYLPPASGSLSTVPAQAGTAATPAVVTVTGRVTSERGEGLAGATVVLKGTTVGAATTPDGRYTLSLPDGSENGTLVFSYIGYLAKEVPLQGRTEVNVSLAADATMLSETVVVGYGVQRRTDLTGAISSVKGEEIRNMPVRGVNEALQGRVAGVQVTKPNGSPGQNADIIIRGAGSINGMPPLYIVDGIRMGTGNNFNIQDVESIEVLKDASAAAIYGAQAAGGVVLVTTRRGSKDGRVNVDFNSYYGVRQPVNLYTLLGRDDFFRAKKAFGSDVSAWGDPSQLPDTDWVNELYGNGKEQNYTLALSGGSQNANFYVSGNYLREDGVRLDNWFQRYNLRINSDYTLGKRLKVGETLFAWKRELNPTQSGNIPFRSVPTMPVRDETNPFGGWGRQPAGGYYAGNNPVAEELIHHRLDQDYAVEGSVYADLEIITGLHLRTTLGTSLVGGTNSNFREAFNYGSLANPNARLVKDFYKQENYTANSVLTYGRAFGQHDLRVMAGYEAYREDRTTLRGEAAEFAVPVAESFGLNVNPGTHRIEGGVFPQRRLLSQFGRLNYNFADKYLLTATVRRDGSDRFGPTNKFGVFPSFSLGWRVSEEGFFKNNVAFVSNLKFRGGYGVLGNDNIDQYLYQSAFRGSNITGLPDGTRVQGYGLNLRLPNELIKWEEVQQTDIGMDLGLWQNRVTVAVDWYSRQTKDMIYRVPVPLSAGLDGNPVSTNIGQMSNKGVEVEAAYRGNLGGFTYQVGANASFNRNRVLLLDGVGNNPINDGSAGEYLESVVARTDVGYPMSQFWGYVVEGIFQTDAEVAALNEAAKAKAIAAGRATPTSEVYFLDKATGAGDLRFRDLDGDGQITVRDKTYMGNPWPKMVYGLNLNLGWKGLDLAVLFQGVQGVDIYNGAKHFTQFLAGDYNTTQDIFGASYFAGNGLTNQPRAGFTNAEGKYVRDPNRNYSRISSYFVEDGSFLKLSNLQLGYSLPGSLLAPARMTRARVYVMAQNLFTLTGYSGLDPEIAGGVRARGIDHINTYPRTRLFSVGVELGF